MGRSAGETDVECLSAHEVFCKLPAACRYKERALNHNPKCRVSCEKDRNITVDTGRPGSGGCHRSPALRGTAGTAASGLWQAGDPLCLPRAGRQRARQPARAQLRFKRAQLRAPHLGPPRSRGLHRRDGFDRGAMVRRPRCDRRGLARDGVVDPRPISPTASCNSSLSLPPSISAGVSGRGGASTVSSLRADA